MDERYKLEKQINFWREINIAAVIMLVISLPSFFHIKIGIYIALASLFVIGISSLKIEESRDEIERMINNKIANDMLLYSIKIEELNKKIKSLEKKLKNGDK